MLWPCVCVCVSVCLCVCVCVCVCVHYSKLYYMTVFVLNVSSDVLLCYEAYTLNMYYCIVFILTWLLWSNLWHNNELIRMNKAAKFILYNKVSYHHRSYDAP